MSLTLTNQECFDIKHMIEHLRRRIQKSNSDLELKNLRIGRKVYDKKDMIIEEISYRCLNGRSCLIE